LSAGASDVVSVAMKTTTDERRVKGAVVRGTSLRLLGIDNIDIEVPLEGNLIYIRNRDVPGVVGKVGTILGKHHVNIASLALGRSGTQGGAEANAVVQVDTTAPEAALAELGEMAEIQEVCAVNLE
jgi:D-3-phosphoglycerate dehydrogenase / 2-oxoglutarate reductase